MRCQYSSRTSGTVEVERPKPSSTLKIAVQAEGTPLQFLLNHLLRRALIGRDGEPYAQHVIICVSLASHVSSSVACLVSCTCSTYLRLRIAVRHGQAEPHVATSIQVDSPALKGCSDLCQPTTFWSQCFSTLMKLTSYYVQTIRVSKYGHTYLLTMTAH